MSDENCPFKKYLSIFNLFLYEHGIPNQYFNMHVISPYTICIVEYLYCFYNLKKKFNSYKEFNYGFYFYFTDKGGATIVGIVIVVVVIIIIAGITIFARAKSILCFKGKDEKKKFLLSSPIMFFCEILIYLAGC